MVQKADGMNYAPSSAVAEKVVETGDFVVAATALDHGHIYGQCNGLAEAGAEIRYVYDPDPEKVNAFRERYPAVQVLDSEQALLDKEDVHMVAAAAITNRRGPLGVRVMQHGKDYFTDKAPFTTLDQLADAKKAVAETGKKYMVYYSERLHVEGAVHAENLIADGAIGDVVQVIGLGPHRLSAATRPDWFFDFEQYGGILCDIGSHQIEQFLFYAGAKDATVNASRVGNYNNPEYPELEDFGDAMLTADNGVSNYFRVDWFTPDGLGSWGDGRLHIVAPPAPSKYANTSTSPATPKATRCTSSTTKANFACRSTARSASPTSAASFSTASTAPKMR